MTCKVYPSVVPIFDDLADLPVDGSTLIAAYQSEFGSTHGSGVRKSVPLFFMDTSLTHGTVVDYDDATQTSTTTKPLPAGWWTIG